MHKPDSISENEVNKILSEFEIQMDQAISTRRSDLVLIYKKKINCYLVDFAVPQSENKRKGETGKIPGPCQRTEKVVENESDGDIHRIEALGRVTKNLERELGSEIESRPSRSQHSWNKQEY